MPSKAYQDEHGNSVPPPEPSWRGNAFRLALLKVFHVVSRTLFNVRVTGADNLANQPGTMVVTNHQSDLDGVVVLPILHRACRGRGPLGRLAIVAHQQTFEKHFVAGYVVRRPRWLSFLFYPICVDGMLRSWRWYPIPPGRNRFLWSHLEDILETAGDLPLTEVFREPPETLLPGVTPDATVRTVMCCANREALFANRDFSIFRTALEQTLKERHKARIASSISLFAAILDQGDSLAMAPAGLVVGEGQIPQVKSGPSQIIAQTQRPVTLAPINLTYDLMTTGRGTVFASFGPPITDVESWEPERFAAELQQAINSLGTVTTGQLAAREVQRAASDGHNEIAEPAFKTAVQSEANRLAEAGCHVDPNLLDPDLFDRRWVRFLAHCCRRELLEKDGDTLRFDLDAVLDDSAAGKHTRSPWRAHANELEAIARACGASFNSPS